MTQRESIVARPIKFASLYNALMAEESNDTGKIPTRPPIAKTKKAINKELAKVRLPLTPCADFRLNLSTS
jgi:hypothetical protein